MMITINELIAQVNAPAAVREGISRRVLKEEPEVAAVRRRLWAARQSKQFARGLPSWANRHLNLSNSERVIYLVDPDKFYPQILDELGVTKPTKYDIETAYQIMKMDMQVAHGSYGFTIHVRADGERKRKWNLTMFPGDNQEVLVATAGLEARAHFLRLRGFIPR